jgi:DNA topoisomerase II
VKVKFILAVISGEVIVSNRKRKDIEADLDAAGFDRMSKADAASKRGVATPAESDDASGPSEDAVDRASGKSFDYLLSMAISSLTYEKVSYIAILLFGCLAAHISCRVPE